VTRPLVSIVTPSYNQAEFLEETIRSVLDQDYPAIEYIVVDGASTDGSGEIIRRYADQLAWWTEERDDGQVTALKRGFDHATGEILGWLNSDDTLLPGAVSAVVDVLEHDRDALLVYGDAVLIDARSNPLGDLRARPFDLAEMLRTCQNHVVQPGSLFRRRALEVSPLNEAGYYYFDFEFIVGIGLAGPAVRLDRMLATYRLHEASKSVGAPIRKAEDHLRLYDAVFSHPDLPATLRAVEQEGRARSYLTAGEYFYAGLAMERARKSLLRAFRFDRRLLTPRNLGIMTKTLLPRRLVSALRERRRGS
jgi:glycosyltransferase involved in cell wall biosynthesis